MSRATRRRPERPERPGAGRRRRGQGRASSDTNRRESRTAGSGRGAECQGTSARAGRQGKRLIVTYQLIAFQLIRGVEHGLERRVAAQRLERATAHSRLTSAPPSASAAESPAATPPRFAAWRVRAWSTRICRIRRAATRARPRPWSPAGPRGRESPRKPGRPLRKLPIAGRSGGSEAPPAAAGPPARARLDRTRGGRTRHDRHGRPPATPRLARRDCHRPAVSSLLLDQKNSRNSRECGRVENSHNRRSFNALGRRDRPRAGVERRALPAAPGKRWRRTLSHRRVAVERIWNRCRVTVESYAPTVENYPLRAEFPTSRVALDVPP